MAFEFTMNGSRTSRTEMFRQKEAKKNGIDELCKSCQVSGILPSCALSGCQHFADERHKKERLKGLVNEINAKTPTIEKVFKR